MWIETGTWVTVLYWDHGNERMNIRNQKEIYILEYENM
jgi:hypothetical protein